MTSRVVFSRCFLALLCLAGPSFVTVAMASAEAAPSRVVSVNLCTDQLAMLVAEPGQLHSVSHWTFDPRTAVLAEEAKRYEINHGRAEEIFLMEPDMVIAGTFSNRPAVALLRRLGFRIEEFAPENSIDDIRQNVLRMGELLGRQERAKQLITDFDRELGLVLARIDNNTDAPRVALLFPNGYTFGQGTLLGELIALAGFENATDTLSLRGLARLPLELLVLSTPDLIITGRLGGVAPALANEALEHPALSTLLSGARRVVLDDRYWVCGAPFTIETVRALVQARAEFTNRRNATELSP